MSPTTKPQESLEPLLIICGISAFSRNGNVWVIPLLVSARAGIGQKTFHQVIQKVHDHVIEHQGIDHLTDTQLCFQYRGDQHHGRCCEGSCQNGHKDQKRSRDVGINRHHGRDKCPEHDTALGSQVKLIGPEHDTGRQTRENDRDHPGQDIAQVFQAEAAVFPKEGTDQHLPEGSQGGREFLPDRSSFRTEKDQHECHQEADPQSGGSADDTEFCTVLFTHGKPS